MRLPFTIAVLFGIGGCTVSPTTINISEGMHGQSQFVFTDVVRDAERISDFITDEKENEEEELSLDSSDTVVLNKALPTRPPVPPLPTFTDDELSDTDLIEERLVDHIRELRAHIGSYYQELDKFESQYLNVSLE